MCPASHLHGWKSYKGEAAVWMLWSFWFSSWDHLTGAAFCEIPFQGIVTGEGGDESKGWGHKGQKKRNSEAPSSKNLFWLMIIIVTFAGIQCISPRWRLYCKWECFSFDLTKAQAKAGIHMGSPPTLFQLSCYMLMCMIVICIFNKHIRLILVPT